jgi:hypothetical protein
MHLDALGEAAGGKPVGVCETGFNAGHSASLFLLAHRSVHVVSFDQMTRPYQRLALKHLRLRFDEERLAVVEGDGSVTVPAFAKGLRAGISRVPFAPRRCDFAHTSVPHAELSDLIYLKSIAALGALVIPTALDDVSEMYGRGSAWEAALGRRIVCESACYSAHASEAFELSADFHFAKRGSHQRHIFCAGSFCASADSEGRRRGQQPAQAAHAALSRCTGARRLARGAVMRELLPRILSRSIAQSTVVVVGDARTTAPVHRFARSEGHTTLVLSGDHALAVDGWFAARAEPPPSWVLLAYIDAGGREEEALLSARMWLATTTITYLVIAAEPACDPGTPLPLRAYPSADGSRGAERAVRMLVRRAYKVQVLASTSDRLEPNELLAPLQPRTATHSRGSETAIEAESPLGRARDAHAALLLFATQGLDLAIPAASSYFPTVGGGLHGVTGAEMAGESWCGEGRSRIKLEWQSGDRAVARGGLPLRLTCNWKAVALGSARVERLWLSRPEVAHAEVACVRLHCPPAPARAGRRALFAPLEARDRVRRERKREAVVRGQLLSLQTVCAHRVLVRPIDTRFPATAAPPLSLLVVLIDPISRAHFRRALPRTRAELLAGGFVEFEGYSIVGPNSGPNQVALYSGMALRSRGGVGAPGHAPFLWDQLRRHGYATLKAEDGCAANSNMLQSLAPNVTHGSQIGALACFDWRRPNCIGQQLAVQPMLEHAEQFAAAYTEAGVPYAAFVHAVDSHEDSNALVRVIDRPLSAFLAGWRAAHGESAAMLVLSDHGLHYGPYFRTRPGERERAEPILFVRTPKGAPQIAAGNARARTTPFDVHRTLRELLHLPDSRGLPADDALGHSLLHPLPTKRSPAEMGIPPAFFAPPAPRARVRAGDGCPRAPMPPSVWSFYAEGRGNGSIGSGIVRDPQLRTSARCGEHGVPLRLHHTALRGDRIVGCDGRSGSNGGSLSQCECLTTTSGGWRRCTALGPLAAADDFVLAACNQTDKSAGRGGGRGAGHGDGSGGAGPGRELRVGGGARRAVGGKRHTWVGRSAAAAGPRSDWEVHLRIGKQARLVARAREARAAGRASARHPSVLILELDSVSRAHAQRHLPLTFAFVQSLTRARANAAARGGATTVRGYDFELANVLGVASIANQLPLLAGCLGVSPLEEQTDGFRTVRVAGHPDPVEQRCAPRSESSGGGGESSGGGDGVRWLHDVAGSAGYVRMFSEEFCTSHSPWVTQHNFFNLSGSYDHTLESTYCALATAAPTVAPTASLERIQNWRPWFAGQNVTMAGPAPHCFGRSNSGANMHEWPFRQVERLWAAYAAARVPRFAFVNSIAAHNAFAPHFQTLRLSALDGMLRATLQRLLDGPGGNETIVLLRGDHGLRPKNEHDADWSAQVELRAPWTVLLVPASLLDERIDANLRANTRRLVTGLDLYKTLLGFMQPSTRAEPATPYMTDLAAGRVPPGRTCADARIPGDMCLCEDAPLSAEGGISSIAPSFGICNKISRGLRSDCAFGPHLDGGLTWDPEPRLAARGRG